MVQLDPEAINSYRLNTFHSEPSSRVRNRDEAIAFVNQRGFIFFWPITGIPMPSLWVATAGNRPVADAHDDPGHITWGWKDSLLGRDVWYYGRVLAHKNCMISLDTLPFFYALSPNFGEPETDYLEDYQKGMLPLEAKNVFEALLKEGPLDSITLRRVAHLTGAGTDSRFNRALEVLQTSFRIAPVGTSTNGAWHYSFVYDLFHRHYGSTIDQSRSISEQVARNHLLQVYFKSVAACTQRDLMKIFRWDSNLLMKSVNSLIEYQQIVDHVNVQHEKQEFYCLPGLLSTRHQY